MQDLETLYSKATVVDARTAEQLGPYGPEAYRIGRLLITGVSLTDTGLRGGSGSNWFPAEYVQDAGAVRQLHELGLPTSFGSGPQKLQIAQGEQDDSKKTKPADACQQLQHAMDPDEVVQTLSMGITKECTVLQEVQSNGIQASTTDAAAQTQQQGHPQQHQLRTSGTEPHTCSTAPAQDVALLQHPMPADSLRHAVHALSSHGYDVPLVWYRRGMHLTPETATPADVYAAARVAGAPPSLIHSVLHAASPQSAQMPPGIAAGPIAAPTDSQWQQGYDTATGHFYYYNVAIQVTQWEPPAEGFQPCRAVDETMGQGQAEQLAAHPHEEEQQQEQQQQQPGAEAAAAASTADLPESGWCNVAAEVSFAGMQQQQQQPGATEAAASTADLPEPGGSDVAAELSHAGMHIQQQQETLPAATAGQGQACGTSVQRSTRAERATSRVVLDADTAAHVRSLLPRRMAKYWLQRYSLFSKFDDGIQMDTQAWYSVTPEVLALHQAQMCRHYSGGHLVVDAMAGCGGNAIQMAMVFPQVMCMEISARRCAMIAHNLGVYKVQDRVEPICCDFFTVAPTLLADAIFASPPWGGPAYQHCESFDVMSSMIDGQRSIRDLLEVCLAVVQRSAQCGAAGWQAPAGASGSQGDAGQQGATGASAGYQQQQQQQQSVDGCVSGGVGVVSLFLPRNVDLLQLGALVPEGSIWHAERNFLNGMLKGVTVYCFGSRTC